MVTKFCYLPTIFGGKNVRIFSDLFLAALLIGESGLLNTQRGFFAAASVASWGIWSADLDSL